MISIAESDQNYLALKFTKSNDINDMLVNTYRRLILSELSSFAFAPTDIAITSNTSILNNDHIKHRISLLPIQSFKEKHLPNTNVTLSLSETNITDSIKTITTDHCIIRINNTIVNNMFPSPPVIICNLKEEQKLILTATASYDKAIKNNMYAAAANSYFNVIDDHYILYIESLGQYTCKEIFKFAGEEFLKMLIKLQQIVSDHKNSADNFIEFKIQDENHTLGGIFIQFLQKLKEVKFAGYKMEHPSINNIEITINTDGSKNIKKVVDLVVKKLTELFNKFNIV